MSDLVALNGRSTCDERMCDRNTREPFLNRASLFGPKLPVFELRRMRERSRKRASLTITHNDQTTYQTYISNTTTILHGQEQSWESFQIRCDQLTGPHGPVKFYVAGTQVRHPAVLDPRKARNRLD